MNAIRTRLQAIQLGAPRTFRGMTVFPLVGPPAPAPDYDTLEEAIDSGAARVTEISAGGSVPELRIENDGDRGVFLLDGEQLVGAKQNRVINLSILVPPRTTLVIPVSCVEAGRWSRRSGAFSSSRHALFARARARKAAQVSYAMAAGGRRQSDQARVWSDISEKLESLGVDSDSSAMLDAYETHERPIDDYVEAFRIGPGQVGALFGLGGRVVGLDLFESPGTLASHLGRLLRSCALDALELDASDDAAGVTEARAEKFLDDVASAHADVYPSVGAGQDVRLSAPGLSGGALVLGERILHLGAFRAQ